MVWFLICLVHSFSFFFTMALCWSVASTYLMFGWRQRYLPWNEWVHRASLVPISNPPPTTTLLKSYSCQGPPICNVCFVKKVIEIFRKVQTLASVYADSAFPPALKPVMESPGETGMEEEVQALIKRNATKSEPMHCFWHWSFSRQLRDVGWDWSSALLISSYHPASLSLCLNNDFRGFPVGAAELFLCHPPISLQLHIPSSVQPCWQSRFLHFHKKKKNFFFWLFFFRLESTFLSRHSFLREDVLALKAEVPGQRAHWSVSQD